MMVWVSLQFEKQIISNPMGSIPAVSDIYFLVLPIFEFIPEKAIVLDVVYRFEIKDWEKGLDNEEDGRLEPETIVDYSCEG